MRLLRLAAALSLLAAPTLAQQPDRSERIVTALSQYTVSITADFSGTEILIFGAVKRDAPMPEGDMQVIVTVQGPQEELVVRRKAQRAGIWVNTDQLEVEAAPSFYAVASSAPLERAITDDEDRRWRISTPRAIRSEAGAAPGNADFIDALIRIREREGMYQTLPGAVTVAEDALFSTAVILPASLTEGIYRVRVFLTRNGEVIDARPDLILVHKAGLERWLFRLSREQPLLYGLLTIVIAIGAGWGASAGFRYFRS